MAGPSLPSHDLFDGIYGILDQVSISNHVGMYPVRSTEHLGRNISVFELVKADMEISRRSYQFIQIDRRPQRATTTGFNGSAYLLDLPPMPLMTADKIHHLFNT